MMLLVTTLSTWHSVPVPPGRPRRTEARAPTSLRLAVQVTVTVTDSHGDYWHRDGPVLMMLSDASDFSELALAALPVRRHRECPVGGVAADRAFKYYNLNPTRD